MDGVEEFDALGDGALESFAAADSESTHSFRRPTLPNLDTLLSTIKGRAQEPHLG